MQSQRSQKKFYQSIKFWIIAIASIAFLIVWGMESAKNAPPESQRFDGSIYKINTYHS